MELNISDVSSNIEALESSKLSPVSVEVTKARSDRAEVSHWIFIYKILKD